MAPSMVRMQRDSSRACLRARSTEWRHFGRFRIDASGSRFGFAAKQAADTVMDASLYTHFLSVLTLRTYKLLTVLL
jgi:hypothetical protein